MHISEIHYSEALAPLHQLESVQAADSSLISYVKETKASLSTRVCEPSKHSLHVFAESVLVSSYDAAEAWNCRENTLVLS